jgi:hypothetical protein
MLNAGGLPLAINYARENGKCAYAGRLRGRCDMSHSVCHSLSQRRGVFPTEQEAEPTPPFFSTR